MADDELWLAEVRRWCRQGARAPQGASGAATPAAVEGLPSDDGEPLGYEAAAPDLQARHWPDAPPR